MPEDTGQSRRTPEVLLENTAIEQGHEKGLYKVMRMRQTSPTRIFFHYLLLGLRSSHPGFSLQHTQPDIAVLFTSDLPNV